MQHRWLDDNNNWTPWHATVIDADGQARFKNVRGLAIREDPEFKAAHYRIAGSNALVFFADAKAFEAWAVTLKPGTVYERVVISVDESYATHPGRVAEDKPPVPVEVPPKGESF